MADRLGPRLLLWLHFALLVLGYGLLGFGRFYLGQMPLSLGTLLLLARLVVWTLRVVAALAFVTGLALMALRRGQSESITLAVSTVAAFLLLVLAWV
jgi:hypothetical protein